MGQILSLCAGNPDFCRYCPPEVSRESVLREMKALPPNKKREDKFYIGYFGGDRLAAVMDLLARYPDGQTASWAFS